MNLDARLARLEAAMPTANTMATPMRPAPPAWHSCPCTAWTRPGSRRSYRFGKLCWRPACRRPGLTPIFQRKRFYEQHPQSTSRA